MFDGYILSADGQQRTISICQYLNGDFSINNRAFHNLTRSEQEQVKSYKLMIYVCKGTDKEKLDWFKIINIAGVKLADQELRNAVYTGSWLTDVKRYFSKNGCAAYRIGNKYLSSDMIRQDYLEKALSIRTFTDTQKRTVYEQQNGICPLCNKHFEYEQMHGDHITPWHAGGKTVPENLQMLCRDCNLRKSGQI